MIKVTENLNTVLINFSHKIMVRVRTWTYSVTEFNTDLLKNFSNFDTVDT